MPPLEAPPGRLVAPEEDPCATLRCLTVAPDAWERVGAARGEREPAPTVVALAGAGCKGGEGGRREEGRDAPW